MKLIARLQLKPTSEQGAALLKTLKTANAACNHISEIAWQNQQFGQYKLHHLAYYPVREKFGLSSEIVVRCIGKVADSYKLNKTAKRTFKPLGAIAYDRHIVRYKPTASLVSIWTVGGRQKIAFECGERQRQLLQSQQGQSDLALVDGKWYLLATCEIETPEPRDVEGTLGVDTGIVNIATDSNGMVYSGAATMKTRRRTRRIRGLLQSKGTKSAKRHLKKISRRQSNFTRSENHRISKQIVETARVERKALALENLKGIRDRGNSFNREMRWQLGNWAFDQLHQMICYKAAMAGIPVAFVDPKNTSRICSECGYCDKANRKTQAQFLCLHCGHDELADFNAAKNIVARAASRQPIVSSLAA